MNQTRWRWISVMCGAAALSACGVEGEQGEFSEQATTESAVLSDTAVTGESLPANTLVLTYDDGPDDLTLQLAAYLWGEGIHATFFVNGKRFCHKVNGVCTSPPVTGGCPLTGDHWKNNKIYDESVLDMLQIYGHRIANHTEDHCNLGVNPGETDWEIKTTQEILDRHAWNGPYLFRPPYGAWSASSGNNARGDICLDKLVGPVVWEIDGGDWACWANGWDVDSCLQNYISAVDARPNHNGIILMHDRPEFNVDDPNYYSGLNNTLELTKRFVVAMRARGYTFGTIESAVPSNAQVRNYSYCGNYSDYDSFTAGPGYYRSIHLGNVDGDQSGYSDVCARGANGIFCAKNMGNGQFAPYTNWLPTNFTDAFGWAPEQYGSTVQLGDINHDGRADVCGRGGSGIVCATANNSGTGFNAANWWSWDYSDGSGWAAAESYYGSIHLADVNGDGWADVCGRGAAGIWCSINNHASWFNPATLWMGGDFKNSVGWFPSQYGATIQFGDINGDGRADVCGRGGAGMLCAISNGTSFNAPQWWTTWPDFSDNDSNAGGWTSPLYYRTIRLADVNGDGRADVCGRTAYGIVCANSNGGSFGRYAFKTYTSVFANGNDYTDALGWNNDIYASTIQFGRLDPDGKMDICGRGSRGMLCGLSQ